MFFGWGDGIGGAASSVQGFVVARYYGDIVASESHKSSGILLKIDVQEIKKIETKTFIGASKE